MFCVYYLTRLMTWRTALAQASRPLARALDVSRSHRGAQLILCKRKFSFKVTDHLKVCHHHLRCRGRMCPSSTVDTYIRGSQEASRSPNSTTGDGLLHLLQSPPHSYSQNYNDGDGWNNNFCSQTVDRRHAQSFAKFVILYTTAHALFQFFGMSW